MATNFATHAILRSGRTTDNSTDDDRWITLTNGARVEVFTGEGDVHEWAASITDVLNAHQTANPTANQTAHTLPGAASAAIVMTTLTGPARTYARNDTDAATRADGFLLIKAVVSFHAQPAAKAAAVAALVTLTRGPLEVLALYATRVRQLCRTADSNMTEAVRTDHFINGLRPYELAQAVATRAQPDVTIATALATAQTLELALFKLARTSPGPNHAPTTPMRPPHRPPPPAQMHAAVAAFRDFDPHDARIAALEAQLAILATLLAAPAPATAAPAHLPATAPAPGPVAGALRPTRPRIAAPAPAPAPAPAAAARPRRAHDPLRDAYDATTGRPICNRCHTSGHIARECTQPAAPFQ